MAPPVPRGRDGLSPFDFPLDITELYCKVGKHIAQTVQLTAELLIFSVHPVDILLEIHQGHEFMQRHGDTPVLTGHGLQNAVNGHVAIVEVAEDFHLVINLGQGNGIQNGLVNQGTGSGEALGILVLDTIVF